MLCDAIILREGISYRDKIVLLRRPIDAEFYYVDKGQGTTLTICDGNSHGLDRFQIIGSHITEVLARNTRTNTNYKLRELPRYNNTFNVRAQAPSSDVGLRNRIALAYLLVNLKAQEQFHITQEFLEDLEYHGLS